MERNLTGAEETVDAVLQEVLDGAHHWTTPETHEDQVYQVSVEPREQGTHTQLQNLGTASTDQAQTTPTDSSDANHLSAAAAAAMLSHMPPVLSAINPLFCPAELVRPQSAQLQNTLSSMKRQLSALEESMQQPTGQLPSPSSFSLHCMQQHILPASCTSKVTVVSGVVTVAM